MIHFVLFPVFNVSSVVNQEKSEYALKMLRYVQISARTLHIFHPWSALVGFYVESIAVPVPLI